LNEPSASASPSPSSSLRGRLLVATPVLLDPNFARTVVLMLEHGEDGAVGVVLNRPSPLTAAETLTAWEPVCAEPAVVFVGGPVQPGGVIGLAEVSTHPSAPTEGVTTLWPGLGTVDLDGDPLLLAPPVTRVRCFAGYSGWGPLQLEGELATGSWFTVNAEPGDLWTSRPDRLWSEVLRRQPGRIAQFAHCPPDPAVN
jgi:putative transcriptional regulator